MRAWTLRTSTGIGSGRCNLLNMSKQWKVHWLVGRYMIDEIQVLERKWERDRIYDRWNYRFLTTPVSRQNTRLTDNAAVRRPDGNSGVVKNEQFHLSYIRSLSHFLSNTWIHFDVTAIRIPNEHYHYSNSLTLWWPEQIIFHIRSKPWCWTD
jgi:hypothetical protein